MLELQLFKIGLDSGIDTSVLTAPTLIVPNLRYATNTIEIKAVYVNDEDYNSPIASTTITTTDVPKLAPQH